MSVGYVVGRAARTFVVGALASAALIGFTAPASAEPSSLDRSTVLQVPGVLIGWPLTRGAAVYNPTVFHGDGRINPTPAGFGYVYQWNNLSTGASGTITDHHPERSAVPTGPGQVVVTTMYSLPGMADVYGTPSLGTFFVTP